ncbi:hypothetical protein FKP32DRAFT_1607355 [Trametes sanguinea]|nr:hypothetical protein FKP32DRAFT_1607355 [Trametes sanguinea]
MPLSMYQAVWVPLLGEGVITDFVDISATGGTLVILIKNLHVDRVYIRAPKHRLPKSFVDESRPLRRLRRMISSQFHYWHLVLTVTTRKGSAKSLSVRSELLVIGYCPDLERLYDNVLPTFTRAKGYGQRKRTVAKRCRLRQPRGRKTGVAAVRSQTGVAKQESQPRGRKTGIAATRSQTGGERSQNRRRRRTVAKQAAQARSRKRAAQAHGHKGVRGRHTSAKVIVATSSMVLRARANLADSERRRFKEERKCALSHGNMAHAS